MQMISTGNSPWNYWVVHLCRIFNLIVSLVRALLSSFCRPVHDDVFAFNYFYNYL